MQRIDWDSYFIEITKLVAQRNGCLKRHVGAVLVKDGKIAAKAHNFSKTNKFTDVDAERWSNTAISTMEKGKFIKGYEDGSFGPDKNITREQIAAIMFRYAKYRETAPTGAWAIKLDYADLAEISDYALESVMFCKLKGIMQGKGENNFAPKDNATRAMEAVMICNALEIE